MHVWCEIITCEIITCKVIVLRGVSLSMINSFRDLIAFQKAYQMSLEIHRLTLEFPRYEQMELANQLRRASKSICLNIAEGFGRKQLGTLQEFKRYMVIALGSCDEVQVRVALDYCKDLSYIDAEQHVRYELICNEIGKLLHNMLTKWT